MIRAAFIGIDRYRDPRIPDLNGAGRDATALWAVLSDSIEELAAPLITDDAATLEAVTATLDETLGGAAEDDVVLLSFAGHGTPDHRLVVADTSTEDLVGTTLDMGTLAERFRTTRARAVVLLLDCCFSGGAPARVLDLGLASRDIGIPLTEVSGQGRILLAASAPDQAALEDPQARHGLFTRVLPRGGACRAEPVRRKQRNSMDQLLPQVLLLLGTALAAVVVFLRLRVPSSLGYLLVGVILGPYTAGPVVADQPVRTLAEFGIVFLLFTIGLRFSPPQIRALRHQVLGLGTGQVVLTTAAVALLAWLAGLPAEAAFVVGAVFAQSSTTILSKQLAEQREDNTQHGRLATAMSVFQDITAVPFVVVIPALGAAVGAGALAASLGWALAKAALAFAVVFAAGRWGLRPLFHLVAERRSTEVFTLAVLFVSLVAGWATSRLGLSMAFGAFLVGMMLGETEFRHQVEAAIRPFRDVLLGLFFIGIGMLFDPGAVLQVWPWALLGALVLLGVKAVVVALLARWSGIGLLTAWRTGLLLAVGGEFGFALVAIALGAGAIDPFVAQVTLASVLFSMIGASLLIRYNEPLARLLTPRAEEAEEEPLPVVTRQATGHLQDHVIVCGYGRIGQSVGHFLEEEGIPYVALDLDPAKVRQAHIAGEPAFYGDAAEPGILEAVGVETARLLVISHADTEAALAILGHLRELRPDLPVMVRTTDEGQVEALRRAGASEVVPETLEASLMIAAQALLLLRVPPARVVQRIQEQRASRYRLLREFDLGQGAPEGQAVQPDGDRLRAVALTTDSAAVGRTLAELELDGIVVTALVREGRRELMPREDIELRPGDALVLFGAPEDLQRAERKLQERSLA